MKMIGVIDSGSGRKEKSPQPDRREFMLAALRSAKLRVSLIGTELDEIGISLKHGMITPECAVSWLDHAGLMNFVNVEPFTNKIAIDGAVA